jgi:hypothetical protein
MTGVDGLVVAVVARWSDGPDVLADPLLDAGAIVLICAEWSWYFDPPDDERLLGMVLPAVRYPGRAFFLTSVDGLPINHLGDEPNGVTRFVRWIRRTYGRLDAVVIGAETGLAGVWGEPIARRLDRAGGEVLVLEGRSSTADEWARTFGLDVGPGRPVVVRWKAGGRRRTSQDALGPVATALLAAGVVERPTRATLRRAHAACRRTGDPLSGLAWDVVGSGDHDHGGSAFVTTRSRDAVGGRADLSVTPWWSEAVTSLDPIGLDGVILSDHNGVAVIEAAYDGGLAVRRQRRNVDRLLRPRRLVRACGRMASRRDRRAARCRHR